MISTNGGAFARLVAGGAAAATALAGFTIGLAAPAHAAVNISGSLVDATGNYVQGQVYVYTADGTPVAYDYTDNGTFDFALEDGAYKLEFNGFDHADEWYRDKADEATADVITVAGAGQVLAPWTVESLPYVTGAITAPSGRPVSGGSVEVYDAATGNQVGEEYTDPKGGFRLTSSLPSVKLRFSGYDPRTGDQLASEFYMDKGTLAAADAVAPTSAGANVGTVVLAPGGSIAGRVTSEAGAPVYRAQACSNLGGCDWTDANGYYLIEGVDTGEHVVSFNDPIGDYAGELYNNVPLTDQAAATRVAVAPGQAVVNIDAALAAAPVVAPVGVDLSGTVRDELGNIGVGYEVLVYDAPADARTREVVARTYSNRSGAYHFTELDRLAGKTQFKVLVDGGDGPREEGDFARRDTWSGNKVGYETASVITAAPQVLDFTLPVAGGISGAVTTEAGGPAESGYAAFTDADDNLVGSEATEADGTYDNRALWAGDYTVMFGAYLHVPEWWKDALPEGATKVTVKPGQVVTGISGVLTKEVKAIERPEVVGNAWVGKTLSLDAGRWNTQARSKISYEWLVGNTVVATGPTLKLTKKNLGDKVTGRVTNDAGFAQGQAITKATFKVGYQPKVKAKVTKKSAAITLKVKPLKAKKVKATVTVFEIVGTKKNGDDKLKKLGKGKIKKGTGKVTFKKALGKGKHKLVFTVKGKGKVGSGDIEKKIKLKR